MGSVSTSPFILLDRQVIFIDLTVCWQNNVSRFWMRGRAITIGIQRGHGVERDHERSRKRVEAS
ncbi:hypothetical protein C7B65_22700 [Phormidesmis priestleyi ULC007]|uniref:Uncharacterized protein n=1 Tax=Phormidesmis priestleyi ULC007 TaxID=1920490 RepID=A0A2T1D6C8_9CYAN|nr:hypothetical protein C7B65_22700 [Phormidesmis priestleyi ULC007]PZO52235.1 MAG: hypothetical protein DCF14_07150 [Phormidesmis priestleyi]